MCSKNRSLGRNVSRGRGADYRVDQANMVHTWQVDHDDEFRCSRNRNFPPLINLNWCSAHQLALAFSVETKSVHCQRVEGLLSKHFDKPFHTYGLVLNLICIHRIPQTKNNRKHIYTFSNDNRYILSEKLISIDVLNINWSLLEAKKSNPSSYFSENGRHCHVAMYHICLICTAICSAT